MKRWARISATTHRASSGRVEQPAPLVARKPEALEADQHHGPGRGLRDCSADGEVEAEAAGPVSEEPVAEGQIEVGSEVGAEIDDVITEETLGDCKVFNVTSRTSTPSASMVNSIDWTPTPLAKPLT